MSKKNINRPDKLSRIVNAAAVDFLRKNAGKVMNHKQIASGIGFTDTAARQQLIIELAKLRNEGLISEPERGKYMLKQRENYITGVVDVSSFGAGYVRSDQLDKDLYIHAKNLKGAMTGDTVKAGVYMRKGRVEGEIIQILKRGRSQVSGVLKLQGKQGVLIADDPRFEHDILITPANIGNAKDGQKVVVKITEWPSNRNPAKGEVLEILGYPGESDAEMNAILADFEFPLRFPKEVEQYASKIPETIPPAEISNRRDFRNITTLTIDPVDAKDFDDALSVQYLENGNFEIGIHIADVSWYMPEGSVLDEEAIRRATSIYLVDRVIPMLPEKLSNMVCSLRPNEDKLCFSAVFEINEHAEVIKQWFGRTIIHSNRRFTYEEAQEIIDKGEGDLVKELGLLNDLAKKLRAIRFKKGAINFEREEVKFNLDENNKPIGVYIKKIQDSNHLIEEFMLLANRKVAEWCSKIPGTENKRTFVYRIHDSPQPERLQEFSAFVNRLGYKVNFETNRQEQISASMNKLLKDIKGKGEQDVIEMLAIRSMAKAIYSTNNIGHYGLAFPFYTHFTSPIRRYPDVMVHRLLQHYLDGGKSAEAEKLEGKCRHSSDMEKTAAEAERTSVKYMQMLFLKDKVGQVFDGIISGMNDYGMFVEIIENKCEGMVRLRDIDDDFYSFDAAQMTISAQLSGAKYRLGDRLKIKVHKVNTEKRQIDFRLAEFI